MSEFVERHGGPPDLQSAFKHFVLDFLRGRSLDTEKDREAAEGKFPDFACFGDRLLIEIKCLQSDQEKKLQAVFDEKIDPSQMPIFYGKMDGEKLLKKIRNADEVRRGLINKLARTVETQLRKANNQFESYKARHPKKNVVTVCVFLNSQIREFDPTGFVGAVRKAVENRQHLKANIFSHVDAVLMLSEKHVHRTPDGRLGLPIVIYENDVLFQHAWKQQFVEHICEKWSEFRTGGQMLQGARYDNAPFDIVHDIPNRMPRHDMWRLEYKRRPYLQSLPIDRLRIAFNRNVALSARTFVKGEWAKPPKTETAENMRRFTHLIEEINSRGLDMREMSRDKLTAPERNITYQGIPIELRKLLDT